VGVRRKFIRELSEKVLDQHSPTGAVLCPRCGHAAVVAGAELWVLHRRFGDRVAVWILRPRTSEPVARQTSTDSAVLELSRRRPARPSLGSFLGMRGPHWELHVRKAVVRRKRLR